ncbi:sigma-70 family RNA polymerase sigma factor [Sulfuriroseicoccus oceanibius]|uniref:Sigma-70 family RNA polymerase sigma factor n=1 Tax=Sulfuriroseicoccus oceanibius TaxID=2707525 RepID=A0A6B3LEF7_9BACT|nr:sigma-70 family RNA polymerase sigma factor [Sulfuriroseicoccus oceanibius]QQL44824.1 sigma-70 family RNA polymerase sigma factor [Sulfuriroseicoccus oceanibius]
MSKNLDHQYLQLVTRYQGAIYGYVNSLAPGLDVEDVVQQVNIVLWKKADTFQPHTNFKAFAFRIAYLKTMEALRKAKQQNWLQFDSDVLELINEQTSTITNPEENRQQALRDCLEKLDPEDRERINARYTRGETVRSIANQESRSEGSLQQHFFRLRKNLKLCIQKHLLNQEEDFA